MSKRINDGTYWDAHDLLTRNGMFNYAIGGRGTGKTYDAKYKRIRHFIKTRKQFIYLRRYKSEFEDKSEFFTDVIDNFPGWEFKVEGMKGYMRRLPMEGDKPEKWRTVCFFITLANALSKKSVPYPDVDMIIFDEFIIDKGNVHYMSNEVKQFQDFYNTVDRFQDRVRVLFLANAVALTNPYFIWYHLKPRKDKRFITASNGFHVVEMVQSEKFRRHVDNTRFGQMIKGTAYYDYAVSNVFHDDNDKFIARKSEDARFYFALRFDGKTVGIWVDYSEGVYYVCRRYPKDALIYVLTKSDMQPNLLMIEKSSVVLRSVRKLYMQGSVRFDSIETREFFNNVFDYLGF